MARKAELLKETELVIEKMSAMAKALTEGKVHTAADQSKFDDLETRFSALNDEIMVLKRADPAG